MHESGIGLLLQSLALPIICSVATTAVLDFIIDDDRATQSLLRICSDVTFVISAFIIALTILRIQICTFRSASCLQVDNNSHNGCVWRRLSGSRVIVRQESAAGCSNNEKVKTRPKIHWDSLKAVQ
mmetsp:Transcript_4724/g.10420  ORF Transcript_4724/g.10420 Transcript_4724/m.10420 type:complete len:126 (+) Transcript_4724:1928-2305(+)